MFIIKTTLQKNRLKKGKVAGKKTASTSPLENSKGRDDIEVMKILIMVKAKKTETIILMMEHKILNIYYTITTKN